MARPEPRILGVGLAAGLLAGLLGVGGGLIMGPALILKGLDLRRATGTALAVVPAAAAVAVVAEYFTAAHNHDPLLALAIACGGPFGVAIGRAIDKRLGASHLKLLFLVVLLIASARSLGLFGQIPEQALDGISAGSRNIMLFASVGLGILAGICSILFGVGGGIVVVPGLVFLVGGVGFHQATAVSLMAMVPTSLISLRVAHRDNRVVGRWLPALFLGSLPAVIVGVYLRNGWLDARPLTIGFGLFLLLVSWRMMKPAPQK